MCTVSNNYNALDTGSVGAVSLPKYVFDVSHVI